MNVHMHTLPPMSISEKLNRHIILRFYEDIIDAS
jgi:hypothetical protein